MAIRIPRLRAHEVSQLLERLRLRSRAEMPDALPTRQRFPGQDVPVPETVQPLIDEWMAASGLGSDAPGLRRPRIPTTATQIDPQTGQMIGAIRGEQAVPPSLDFGDQSGILDKIAALAGRNPEADLRSALFADSPAGPKPLPVPQVHSALDALMALNAPSPLPDSLTPPASSSAKLYQAQQAAESADEWQREMRAKQAEFSGGTPRAVQDLDRLLARRQLESGAIEPPIGKPSSLDALIEPGTENDRLLDLYSSGRRRGLLVHEGMEGYDPQSGFVELVDDEGVPRRFDILGRREITQPGIYPEPQPGNITSNLIRNPLRSPRDFIPSGEPTDRWYKQYAEMLGIRPELLRDELTRLRAEGKKPTLLALKVPRREKVGRVPLPEGWTYERAAQIATNPVNPETGLPFNPEEIQMARRIVGATGPRATPDMVRDILRITGNEPGLNVEPSTNTTVPKSRPRFDSPAIVGFDSDALPASALPTPISGGRPFRELADRYPNATPEQLVAMQGPGPLPVTVGDQARIARPQAAGYDESEQLVDVRNKRSMHDDVTRQRTEIRPGRAVSQTLTLEPAAVPIDELAQQLVKEFPEASDDELRELLKQRALAYRRQQFLNDPRSVERGLHPTATGKDVLALRQEGWLVLPRPRQIPTGQPGVHIIAVKPGSETVMVTQPVGMPIEVPRAELDPVGRQNLNRALAANEGSQPLYRKDGFKLLNSGRAHRPLLERAHEAGIPTGGVAMGEDAAKLAGFGVEPVRMPHINSPNDRELRRDFPDVSRKDGSKVSRAYQRVRLQTHRENIKRADGGIILTDEFYKGGVGRTKRSFKNPETGKRTVDSRGGVAQQVYQEINRYGKRALAINIWDGQDPEVHARRIVNWMLENQVHTPYWEGLEVGNLSKILPKSILEANPKLTRGASIDDLEVQRSTEIQKALQVQEAVEKRVIELLKDIPTEGAPRPAVPGARTDRFTALKSPEELAAAGPDAGDLARRGEITPGRETGQELTDVPTLQRTNAQGMGGFAPERQVMVSDDPALQDMVTEYFGLRKLGDQMDDAQFQRFEELTGRLQTAGREGLLDGIIQKIKKGAQVGETQATEAAERAAREAAQAGAPIRPDMDTAAIEARQKFQRVGPPDPNTPEPRPLDPSLGRGSKRRPVPKPRTPAEQEAVAREAWEKLRAEGRVQTPWEMVRRNPKIGGVILAAIAADLFTGSPDEAEAPEVRTAGFNPKALSAFIRNIASEFRQVAAGEAPNPRVTSESLDKFGALAADRQRPTVERQAGIKERALTALHDRKLPASKPQRDAIARGADIAPENQVEQTLNLEVGGGAGRAQIGMHEVREAMRPIESLGIRGETTEYLDALSALRAWETAESKTLENARKAEQARQERRTGDYQKYRTAAQTLQDNLNRGTVAPKGLTRAEAQTKLQQLEASLGPEKMGAIKQLATVIDTENKTLIRRFKDEGLLRPEVAEDLLNRKTLYVPMYAREGAYDEALQAFVKARTRTLQGKVDRGVKLSVPEEKLVQTLLGTGDPTVSTVDPLDAWAQYHQEAYKEIARNRAAKSIVDQRTLPGMEFDPRSKTGIKFLKSTEAVPEGMGAISYMENGVERRYAVPLEWAEATTFVGEEVLNPVMKAMAKTRAVFQGLATSANLAFAMRNIPRDLQASAMLVKDIGPGDVPELLKLYARNLQELLAEQFRGVNPLKTTGGEMRQAYYESGADLSQLSKNINYADEYSGTVNPSRKKGIVGRTIAGSQKLLNATEQSTKEAVFEILVKKYERAGLEPAQARKRAAIYTREFGGSPDYAKMGTLTGQVRDFVMFFNPQAQGAIRTVKAYKQNPRRLLWQAGAISGGLVALHAYNSQHVGEDGKPLLWDVPESDRNTHIVILTGGTRTTREGRKVPNYIRIPLAHEARAMFVPVQDILRALSGDPSVHPVETASAVSQTFLPGGIKVDPKKPLESAALSAISGLNPIARVAVEQATNTNSLSGAPIVGRRVEKEQDWAQGTEGTSPTARLAGQVLRQIGLGDSVIASPPRLESAYRGMLPGLGEVALDTADLMTRPLVSKERGPAGLRDQIARAPGLNQLARSFVGGNASQLRNDAADTFYAGAQQASELVATMNSGKLDPRDPEAVWARTYNTTLQAYIRALAQLNRQRDAIQQKPGPNAQTQLEQIAQMEQKYLEAGAAIVAKKP